MTNGARQQVRPANIDQLIAIIQREFPTSAIRITGRARTTRRQAELMAQRIRNDRLEFIGTYRQSRHITEMDQWFLANRGATFQQTVNEFETIYRPRKGTRSNCIKSFI